MRSVWKVTLKCSLVNWIAGMRAHTPLTTETARHRRPKQKKIRCHFRCFKCISNIWMFRIVMLRLNDEHLKRGIHSGEIVNMKTKANIQIINKRKQKKPHVSNINNRRKCGFPSWKRKKWETQTKETPTFHTSLSSLAWIFPNAIAPGISNQQIWLEGQFLAKGPNFGKKAKLWRKSQF